MQLTYNGETYTGFRRYKIGDPNIAVIEFDGDTDLWTLDPENIEHGKAELLRYYYDEWQDTRRFEVLLYTK